MHRFANPTNFHRIAKVALVPAALLALVCFAVGIYQGLWASPPDYQQGETARIMYIHVPVAIFGSGVYFFMALMSASFLIWRHPLADVLAREAAPIGALFTLITLATGMLWGKPTWGAYWVWDAWLTSVLILELLYLGYLGMTHGGGQGEQVKVASAWLALIGAINLPIIKFSVEWWNSLHQGESLLRAGGPHIAPAMLHPLLWMLGAYAGFFVALLLLRADTALQAVKLRRLQIQKIARKNAAIEKEPA